MLNKGLGWTTDELPDDPMLKRAATLGNVHEERLRDRYRTEFGDVLVEFDRPKNDAETHATAPLARATHY